MISNKFLHFSNYHYNFVLLLCIIHSLLFAADQYLHVVLISQDCCSEQIAFGLNNRNLLCHGFGEERSESKCWSGHDLSEGLREAFYFLASNEFQQSLAFLDLRQHNSNLCLHHHMIVFSLCLYPSFPVLIRISIINLGLTLSKCDFF